MIPAERIFSKWLDTVVRLTDGLPGVSVAADRAWFAFEDGMTASDYALALQLGGDDDRCISQQPLLDGPLLPRAMLPR